ncbi:MAG: formylglycine-generating enzyme family protein, partial [Leptodesmis sp.]|uniref:formylglycine-generating enzyme family protein n=1 Tax=Leptodesmis sp. TaxID=3100501 RepID=UPI003D11CD52
MSISEWSISQVELTVMKVDATGHPLEQITQSIQVSHETLADGIAIALVAIPGGDFLMGSPNTEEGWHPSQSPQHMVSVAPFWMARYPITQAQWQAVAQWPKVQQSLTPHPFCFSGANYPAEQISWPEAIEFCARLSARTGRTYRLPTEAEWEYACRATSQTPFYFGETITTDLANYSGVNWEYNGKICNKGFYGQGPEGCDRRQTTAVGSLGTANLFSSPGIPPTLVVADERRGDDEVTP